MVFELLISVSRFKDEYGTKENMLAYKAIL